MRATTFDPDKLISGLKALGFEFWIEGENIRFRYGKDGDPPDISQALFAEIRDHKKEVKAFLVEEVKRMPLEEFKKGNYLLKVQSSLLDNEMIFFASNPATVEKCGTLAGPVYTAAELETILASGAKGEDLKRLHEAKKEFNGKFFNDSKPTS